MKIAWYWSERTSWSEDPFCERVTTDGKCSMTRSRSFFNLCSCTRYQHHENLKSIGLSDQITPKVKKKNKKKMLNIWYYIGEIVKYTSKDIRHEVTRSYSDKKHVGKWIGAFFSRNQFLFAQLMSVVSFENSTHATFERIKCRRLSHSQQSGGMASGQSAPKDKQDTQHSVRRNNLNRIRFTGWRIRGQRSVNKMFSRYRETASSSSNIDRADVVGIALW